jgi:hypothetical protein
MNLVEKCRTESENNIGQRVAILEVINCLLPTETKLIIPALITNTCIDNILSALEVTLLPPIYAHL